MAKNATQDDERFLGADTETGKELAKSEAMMASREFNEVRFSGMDLDDVDGLTFDAAVAALTDAGIEVTEATVDTLGDGFTLVDKEKLLNRPCLLLTWELDSGQNRMSTAGFFIVRGIAKDGMRFWFTCGGYGLAEELRQLSSKRRKNGQAGTNAGLFLPNGLRRDQVEGETDTGEHYKNWIYRAAL